MLTHRQHAFGLGNTFHRILSYSILPTSSTPTSEATLRFFHPKHYVALPRAALHSSAPLAPLSAEQRRAFDLALRGHNVFITGPEGTGKSHIARHIKAFLDRMEISCAITAPTGIAAVLLGGRTVTSWGGVREEKQNVENLFESCKRSPNWKQTRVLIIDEVSLLHPDLMQKLDWMGKKFRSSYRPLGGIQLIVCGDFYQLPPEANPRRSCNKCGLPVPLPLERKYQSPTEMHVQENIPESFLRDLPPGVNPHRWITCEEEIWKPGENMPTSICNHVWNDTIKYAFQTVTWQECNFKTVYLKTVYRQSDPEWIDILNKVRTAELTSKELNYLESLSRPLEELIGGIKPTKICGLRSETESDNATEFKALQTEEYVFKSINQLRTVDKDGNIVQVEYGDHEKDIHTNFFRFLPVSEQCRLKKGAQVMLLTNLSLELQLVNGSRGVVSDIRHFTLAQYIEFYEQYISQTPSVRYKLNGRFLTEFFHACKDCKSMIAVPFVTFAPIKPDKSPPKAIMHPIFPEIFDLHIPHRFPDKSIGETELFRIQLPLTLAWSITVYKSQGMTLDYAIVDIRNPFTVGQGYVALSRCREPRGLQILKKTKSLETSFIAHEAVKEFYDKLDIGEKKQKVSG